MVKLIFSVHQWEAVQPAPGRFLIAYRWLVDRLAHDKRRWLNCLCIDSWDTLDVIGEILYLSYYSDLIFISLNSDIYQVSINKATEVPKKDRSIQYQNALDWNHDKQNTIVPTNQYKKKLVIEVQ